MANPSPHNCQCGLWMSPNVKYKAIHSVDKIRQHHRTCLSCLTKAFCNNIKGVNWPPCFKISHNIFTVLSKLMFQWNLNFLFTSNWRFYDFWRVTYFVNRNELYFFRGSSPRSGSRKISCAILIWFIRHSIPHEMKVTLLRFIKVFGQI